MVEIVQTVLEILRVTNFASQYSNPIDQLLYAVFFPMVLLVVILFILMNRIIDKHKGLQMLLGVSFFIFVIVYPPNAQTSLYGALAPIGAIWYLFVVVLGFFWILLTRMWPKEEGGKRGLSTSALGEAFEVATGKRLAVGKERTKIQREIRLINDQIKALKAEQAAAVNPGQKEQYDKELAALIKEKKALEDALRIR